MVKIRKSRKDAQKKFPYLPTASGRLKTTESSGRGSPKDTMDASQVCSPSDGQF